MIIVQGRSVSMQKGVLNHCKAALSNLITSERVN